MKASEADIIIIPGYGGAGPDHWQSRWARRMPTARLVKQKDWDAPDPDDWSDAIVAAVDAATLPVVLVAQGAGALTVARAGPRLSGHVAGAFLVTPIDPDHPDLPEAARVFAPVSTEPLPFPSFVIASRNNPYCRYETAEDMAYAWGARIFDAGEAGTIDTASDHGPWPEGLMVFARFLSQLKADQS